MNWHTEQRKISDLVPHPENPRQMTEKQVKDLTASLKKFNLAEIPAINTDNTILAGHQRLIIMSQLGRGEEEIDVRIPSRLLSDKEAKEYLIRSNKNTGEWDMDKLANNFDVGELKEWGFEDFEFGINEKESKENDLSEKITGSYEVVVELDCEEDQQNVYEKLTKEGYKCRVLTL